LTKYMEKMKKASTPEEDPREQEDDLYHVGFHANELIALQNIVAYSALSSDNNSYCSFYADAMLEKIESKVMKEEVTDAAIEEAKEKREKSSEEENNHHKRGVQ